MDVARYLARRQVEEWYKKMKEQGRDHIWMDDVLTKALAERDDK